MLKVQEEQINKQWKASDKATWLEAEIERKWWGGKKDNGGIKKIPLNPKNPKLAFRNWNPNSSLGRLFFYENIQVDVLRLNLGFLFTQVLGLDLKSIFKTCINLGLVLNT